MSIPAFDIQINVKKVHLPNVGMMRRLKLWSLTDGFIVSGPKQLNLNKFNLELEKTGDKVLIALARTNVSNLGDWSDLIDVLRNCEQLHESNNSSDLSMNLEIETRIIWLTFETVPSIPNPVSTLVSTDDGLETIAFKVSNLCIFQGLRLLLTRRDTSVVFSI